LAFSHLRLAPSHTGQLVMPSGEIALLTAWYQPRFGPSSSRLPMFHVPPGAYHIITFDMPTISYTPRSVMTRSCTRRYSPSLSCSRLFGVMPKMYTPGVALTATHFTSRPSFPTFSAADQMPHVPRISAGDAASLSTCSQPRACPNASFLPTYHVGPSEALANQSMWFVLPRARARGAVSAGGGAAAGARAGAARTCCP